MHMRNVFVSYSHRLDQDVVDEFRRKFGNDKMVFSDRSLENKDLSYLSDDTIKNNYIRPQLRLSSVTIVLIGAETGGRWWVDWEIYCSLRKSAGNERNGILGILIPNKQHNIPQRILDNPDNSEIITMPKSAKELEDATKDMKTKDSHDLVRKENELLLDKLHAFLKKYNNLEIVKEEQHSCPNCEF